MTTMDVDHEVLYKLRHTNVSSEYVRVLASDWNDTVCDREFRAAERPVPLEEPAFRHGGFGEALREGDLWTAFQIADKYHKEVLLDVLSPQEIALCHDNPERVRNRIAVEAEGWGLTEYLPDDFDAVNNDYD